MNCDPSSLASAATCFQCIPPGMQSGVRSYLLCQWANQGGTGPCTDPIVDDWIARMTGVVPVADMPSDATREAVCLFCRDLRLAGIVNDFVALNPVIPDSLAAMAYPLIWDPANGNSPWTNNGFLAGDLDVNGLQGDGIGKYMDTGVDSSLFFALNSAALTVYTSDFHILPGNNEVELGASETFGADSFEFSISTWSDPLVDGSALCWSGASFMGFSLPLVEILAFYSANRTAIANMDGWWGNSVNPLAIHGGNVNDETFSQIPTLPVFFMARNADGVVDSWSSKRVSFAAIHRHFSNAEMQMFYDAIVDLRTRLGGGVV